MKKIRVYHKKGKGKRTPRFLVKCACGCDNKIEIHYDKDGLEIGGVNGSVDDWEEFFFPLINLINRLKRGGKS